MNPDTAQRQWLRDRTWLGYAGLVPVLACVGLLTFSADFAVQQLATDTLRYYAAVIASFLGAVHWGAAADRDDPLRRARLHWGVMPALLAWTLLMLPASFTFLGFALLFVVILFVDHRLLPLLDDEYRRLRVQLSFIVVAALLIAAFLAPGAGA